MTTDPRQDAQPGTDADTLPPLRHPARAGTMTPNGWRWLADRRDLLRRLLAESGSEWERRLFAEV